MSCAYIISLNPRSNLRKNLLLSSFYTHGSKGSEKQSKVTSALLKSRYVLPVLRHPGRVHRADPHLPWRAVLQDRCGFHAPSLFLRLPGIWKTLTYPGIKYSESRLRGYYIIEMKSVIRRFVGSPLLDQYYWEGGFQKTYLSGSISRKRACPNSGHLCHVGSLVRCQGLRPGIETSSRKLMDPSKKKTYSESWEGGKGGVNASTGGKYMPSRSCPWIKSSGCACPLTQFLMYLWCSSLPFLPLKRVFGDQCRNGNCSDLC